MRDQTVVAEIRELLEAFNKEVTNKTRRRVARGCVTGLTLAAGGFALWFPLAGVAASALAAFSNAMVERVYGESEKPRRNSGGDELLAEAQRALRD